jgi:hypothetical protein
MLNIGNQSTKYCNKHLDIIKDSFMRDLLGIPANGKVLIPNFMALLVNVNRMWDLVR